MFKIIAFDLDGTLTQHRTELCKKNYDFLVELKKSYKVIIVGAGTCERIYNQIKKLDIDIIGNYGLQQSTIENGEFKLVKNIVVDNDKKDVQQKVDFLRAQSGYTKFCGESVEFHSSGVITFPLLGTKANIEDKISFDPDKTKRKKIYDSVIKAFNDKSVVIGGSSSFDIMPCNYNKYIALKEYAKKNGVETSEVLYVGDDFGCGGNDASFVGTDIKYLNIDDYLNVGKIVNSMIGC